MAPLLLTLLLAQPANPYLDEARRLAKDLQFAEAIEQLKIARQVPQLSSAQQLEVLELLGRCQVAEGSRAAAEATFAKMLTLAPDAQLDRKLSPKILEVFDEVKQRLYPADFVRLSPQPARAGQGVLRLVDPWRRAAALVLVRRLDGAAPVEQPIDLQDGAVSFELEAQPGQTLEWWLEARDPAGLVLAGFGSAQQPQQYAVPAVVASGLFAGGPEAPPTPRIQRPAAWILIAAAIAAGSAGGFLQVRSANRAREARAAEWSDAARATQLAAVSDATWAAGFFVGAGAAGAGGLVLFAW